ncbi:hypothetical protein FQZ97_904100 [compost metagenome]
MHQAFVTQHQFAAGAAVPGIRRAAAGQAQHQIAGQAVGLAGPSGNGLHFARAADLLEQAPTLFRVQARRLVDHLDAMRSRLAGAAAVLLLDPGQGLAHLGIFLIAVERAFHRQAGDLGHPFQPIRIAAVNQAGQIVETLFIEAMAGPGVHLLMLRLRPLPFQPPVIGDVQQFGVEVGVALTPGGEEQADEAELIGGVLLATEHRQTQLGDQ